MKVNKNNLPVTQAFLLFVSFVGDCERVASALHLDPEVIRKLAESEGWHAKIAKLSGMSKTGKPEDFARQQSRALSFVQAHQLRRIVDIIISQLGEMTPDELVESLRVTTKGGSYMSARFLADLAATAEKAASLCANALGDTVGERLAREETEGDDMNVSQLHLAVMNALSHPRVKAIDVAAEIQKSVDENVKQIADSPPAASSSNPPGE